MPKLYHVNREKKAEENFPYDMIKRKRENAHGGISHIKQYHLRRKRLK